MEFSSTAKTKQFTDPRHRMRKKNSLESIVGHECKCEPVDKIKTVINKTFQRD